MKRRSLRLVAALAPLLAVLSCGGADGPAPPTSAIARPSDSTLLAGLYASGPVASASLSPDRIGANGSAASRSAAASAEVSWVSLVPGTVPDGTSATIVNRRTAQRITVTTVDGGFDPLPIPASLGDTVEVSVSRPGKPDAAAVMSLAARPGPRIVRSRPPRGQTDAPLNTIITLVFTEPLAPASVNPTTVILATADSPVAGAVRILPGPGYVVEFTPDALLAPSTAYSLTVSGVKNLAGAPLAAPTSIAFSTSVGAASNAIVFDSTAREIAQGDSLVLIAWVGTPDGTGLSDSLRWQSTDSTIAAVSSLAATAGRLVGKRSGTATILASSGNLTAQLTVRVLPVTAQPSTVVVEDFHMIEHQTPDLPGVWWYSPQLTLRDTSPAGGNALIGASLEFPAGQPRVFCAMVRPLGATSLQIFREVQGVWELMLGPGAAGRMSPTDRAVVHLTVRRPDGSATRITVDGPIISGSMPSGNTPWSITGALACG
jgi:hypothetical protein